MPKNSGKNKNAQNSDNFEHDDRMYTSNTRRVSFKPGTNKGKSKCYNSKLLLDNDIDMTGSSTGLHVHRNRGFRGRGGRHHSPAPRLSGMPKKFVIGPLPWYQIIIPFGAKHEKDVILQVLMSCIAPEVFTPLYYRTNGNAVIFYVDDVKLAEKLFNTDRKITMSDGYKLMVIVRNAVPSVNIDDEVKEKMKLAMGNRYNSTTKALDLTKFHVDPELADIFCGLFRPAIMLAVIDIIAENIPDIEALNLNDNKLHGLDHLKILAKLKNLKTLYMGNNRIPYVGSLEPLKDLPLVELYLKGNPLLTRSKDHDIYVSDVRKKFPKLMKLDEVDLPPLIGFDISEDVCLPPPLQSFLINPASQDFIREFLTQYFAIYDADSRLALLDAYHNHATMSLTANYLTNDCRNATIQRLNAYVTHSRNILRVTEREDRRRCLRTGKLQIVSFLSELPKTSHDLMGFTVDLHVSSPEMIILTMSGVYKETNTNGNPTRSFHRTFVIVPNNAGGFCITNDMLYVTNTTKEQEDAAFASSIVVDPTPPMPVETPALKEEEQKMLVTMVGQQTGMNDYWTFNCLQQTGWNFHQAVFVFNNLNQEGKIPPEAFIK